MDIKDFNSGTWQSGYDFKYFVPSFINHEWSFTDTRILELLEKASINLGELNSFTRYVPDIELFTQSYVMKEAVTSSRIEGTRTNMEEAFYSETDIEPEKRDDWNETLSYSKAMYYAIDELKTLPLSSRLIKQTHGVLLTNVRGKHKNPGEFRTSQNWIGGINIKDAVFVPPKAELIGDLMSDLEYFLHNDRISVPRLIKIAIGHYQFETIHPFLDGNGRVGRLLITLYLISEGVLDKPLLFTSAIFEKYKTLYYEKLTFVREKNDLSGWIRFFLEVVTETSSEAILLMKRIIDLRESCTAIILDKFGRKAAIAHKFLDYLFRKPVVYNADSKEYLQISTKSMNNLLDDFIKAGILEEITGYKRNRKYIFRQYIDILRKEY